MALFGKNKGSGFEEDTFVIAGLGNPGKEYENTRHNMGFKCIDALAAACGIDIRKSKFSSLIGQGRIAGRKVVLVKPQTFMNRSGTAVRQAAMYFNVPSTNVIVVYDDIDIPAASIRIRKSGGPGTHNGMRSVVEQLGTRDFPRVRIGIGAAEGEGELVDYVIGKVSASETAILEEAAAAAAKAVEDIIAFGTDVAMNRHNTRK